eukprot:4457085-Prymnesium_polylepis.1
MTRAPSPRACVLRAAAAARGRRAVDRAAHEALLARDEEEYVKAYEDNGGGEKPSLVEIREKAEAERAQRDALEAEVRPPEARLRVPPPKRVCVCAPEARVCVCKRVCARPKRVFVCARPKRACA